MSNIGKFHDTTAFLKVAGLTSSTEQISSDHSLRQDIYFKPHTSTPEHIKKYRRSIKDAPGVKQLHPGIFDDPKEYEKLMHGVKTLESDHVDDCIKGNNLSGIKHFLNKINEDKYARNQREPLGKSIIRNYDFPQAVKNEEFKFGIPTSGNFNAKYVLYSGAPFSEAPEIKSLYNKSHGLTDPGEQKNRNYNWYVNKSEHAFGKPQTIESDGAKKSLSFDFLEAKFPKTNIVDKRLEDFRQATSDMIGKSKFRGTLNSSIDETHIFGFSKNSLNGDSWNVARCINGDPNIKTDREFQEDSDLGKSILYKSKLQNLHPKEYDPSRMYGIPSIRTDLKKKSFSSNYGNEKDAYDLIYPNSNVVRGVDDADFEELIEKDRLRETLMKREYTFSDSEFNILFQLTLRNYPNNEEKVSYKAFIDVMRNLKKEFMKYRTLIS